LWPVHTCLTAVARENRIETVEGRP
jgi:hypothetical protein